MAIVTRDVRIARSPEEDRATMEVQDDGGHAPVVWTIDLEPEAMAAEMAPLFEQSLETLRQRLES